MSDFNTNISNQNQLAPQQQAQVQAYGLFGGYGAAQPAQPQSYGVMSSAAQGQYIPYAQQGASSQGQSKSISLNMEFDMDEAVPEVSFKDLPYITSSGVYRFTIREARYFENADGSSSIRFSGIGVAINDPSYQGRLTFSCWISGTSGASRVSGSFESIIKVLGMYHMHGNKCVPDLVYDEVTTPFSTYKAFPKPAGQHIIVAVRASSKSDRNGVPFFNLTYAFHGDEFSFLEKQKGETTPQFIKKFLEPTGPYFIAFEHRPLLFPHTETSNVPYEYGQTSVTSSHYAQPASRVQSGQFGQAPQVAQYRVQGRNITPFPQGGAQFNQSQYAAAQSPQVQVGQQAQQHPACNAVDVGFSPEKVPF